MVFDDQFLYQLSDNEALAILSSLGFSLRDWPTLQKLGGAKAVLSSELAVTLFHKRRFLKDAIVDLRRKFDHFYQQGGFLVTPFTHAFTRIFRAEEAPLTFFGRDNDEIILAEKCVAIVGARDASAAGLDHAHSLATVLAHHGVTVVSGGARGIDHAAQMAALGAKGQTIAVSGRAFSFIREDPLIRNFKDHSLRAAVLFPYGPFFPQGKFMFVERNRFVAAAADALVVVEGGAGSGTLHTARFAALLNVPLFVMKPAPYQPLSFVPNLLLSKGKARVLGDFENFAKTLLPKNFSRKPNLIVKDAPPKSELPLLLQLINDEKSLSFDELLILTGASFSQLQKDLLDYELEGRIFRQGSQFVLRHN